MTAPTLPLVTKILRQSSKSEKQRLIIAQFGNGYGQVAKDGLNSTIDHWDISYVPIEGTNLTTLETFLNTVGCDVWFSWIPIGETVSKKWRIDKDSKKKVMITKTRFQYSFTMTQVFDLGN
jgi:phage-related protein